MTELLRIEHLTVRHGHTVAVNDLSLTVGQGELFVLLGASGSGKTTLLRAIGGFVRPSSGRIVLEGRDIADLPPHKRPVNTVFQSYALFPHMTVAQNVAFGLRGLPKSEVADRVREMLALVRLDALGDRKPAQLSGGQQQRVALARGLAARPRMLLLDEPLSALDRALREETRSELVRLRAKLGIGFVLVTHDQQEALTMATHIGVMRDGAMVQVGTPEDLYERPNSRFVAEFLGAANIVPAEVAADGMSATCLGARLALPTPKPSGPAFLALRAERLRLGSIGEGIAGTIEETAYAGDRSIHEVRTADGTRIRISEALTDGLPHAPRTVGEPVGIVVPPTACIVLPP